MNYSLRDIGASVAVGLVGAIFLAMALRIDASGVRTQAEALVGPTMVPVVIASLILVLGALELTASFIRHYRSRTDAALQGTESSKYAPLSATLLVRIATIVGIGFAYVWLLGATGYIISTALILPALLVLFGTRSAGKVALMTLSGTAIYYLVFIRLLGLYDPVGWLIYIG